MKIVDISFRLPKAREAGRIEQAAIKTDKGWMPIVRLSNDNWVDSLEAQYRIVTEGKNITVVRV